MRYLPQKLAVESFWTEGFLRGTSQWCLGTGQQFRTGISLSPFYYCDSSGKVHLWISR